MVSVWNSSESAEDVNVTLYYANGSGHYTLPIHLDPYASSSFDLAQLIASQKPDQGGNIIPASVKEGSLVFSSAKGVNLPINLNLNVGVYDVATATCYYGCVLCDGYYQILISPNPFDCPPGMTETIPLYGTYDNGNNYGVSASSASSSNTSVATVDNSGNVTGISPGSTTITADSSLLGYGEVCAYNPSCTSQPYSNFQTTGTADVCDFQIATTSLTAMGCSITAPQSPASTVFSITGGTGGNSCIFVSSASSNSVNVTVGSGSALVLSDESRSASSALLLGAYVSCPFLPARPPPLNLVIMRKAIRPALSQSTRPYESTRTT